MRNWNKRWDMPVFQTFPVQLKKRAEKAEKQLKSLIENVARYLGRKEPKFSDKK